MVAGKYEVLYRTVSLGSLTKAAQELGITQSAVSHTISALENELGFILLNRSRGGITLTAEGEKIYPLVKGLYETEMELKRTAADLAELKTGIIRVGTFTSVAVNWIPGIIKSFSAEHPNVEFRLLSGDYNDVEQWIDGKNVDVAFVALPPMPSCRFYPLTEDRLLAVLPENHPMAGCDRFPVTAFEGAPFITLLEQSDADSRRPLEAAGVRPDTKLCSKDDYALIAMVENGIGISIMPELLLKGRDSHVVTKELDPPASRTIALAIPMGDKAGPATRQFVRHTIQWVKNMGAR